MLKKILTILLILTAWGQHLFAAHIKGGEMYYEYIGPDADPTYSLYKITLTLYIDCHANEPGQLDPSVSVSIFDKTDNSYRGALTINLSSSKVISFDPASNPCIGRPPTDVCYQVRSYTTTVRLRINTKGYLLSFQRCCRVANIVNLVPNSSTAGATYECEIPGTDIVPDGYKNNGPHFATNDATAVCRGSIFTLDFSATQTDSGDSLAYQFCGGYDGGSQSDPKPDVSSPPPYQPLKYQSPYSASFPLGMQAHIDPTTGIVTGTAPNVTGQYVVTVCAYEYRKGFLINVHRKDIHVRVSDCVPLKALLKPEYSYCDDFLVNFKNEQSNPAGSVYVWDYGDKKKADTSLDPQGAVQHQYADTGTYAVRLKVILAGQCVDSTTTRAKVYPGFFPAFKVIGSCILLPLQFRDASTSRYGTVNQWRWDLGDETNPADTSHASSVSWKYSTVGTKTVQLTVGSDKGCQKTVSQSVSVRDKPAIALAFADTLICSIDTLQLHASGSGIFSWGPAVNIYNQNSDAPYVYPKSTTVYTATLNENGCVNTANVQVRVVDSVTLRAAPDTIICLTDKVQLTAFGDGLKYTWTPAASLNDPHSKTPVATPAGDTRYQVLAEIGKCSKLDAINIRTAPYPRANAGTDTTICYGDTARLHGTTDAPTFYWTPQQALNDPANLNAIAFPKATTVYTLIAQDPWSGCPKATRSNVKVNVLSQIHAFAGNDTAAVAGQPLQLHGSGATFFDWQPPTYLNRNDISDPIALLNDNFGYVMKTYTKEGCFAYDTIHIRIFKTKPDIFVPNAFHAGSGGTNNTLRPIPVGIRSIDYFRVYNRWGQLVYQTTDASRGWDGTIGGKTQDTGTYVWMVEGTDYTGKRVFHKGVAVLIR